MNTSQKQLIQKAIDLCGGSQALLAQRIGRRQQTVSKLLNGVFGISAEMSILLDRATDGGVPKEATRPDLFAPAKEGEAA